jgi:K+-sensing histidine kinase KdpD
MNLQSSEQAIVNAIYAAIAWLILDFGFLLLAHGKQTLSILVSRPEMAAGAIITIACIVGLFYKSRLAAIVLFLIFLLPLIIRAAQGVFPSTILLLFSLILLYFFLTAVLGTFSYHHLKTSAPNTKSSD